MTHDALGCALICGVIKPHDYDVAMNVVLKEHPEVRLEFVSVHLSQN